MAIETVNGEQEMIIEELEKVLTFLKGVHVKNEEALAYIKKPLDDLKSSLKYLPIGPSFNDLLPTEVKVNIFSSLCDSTAFIAAAVCQEWKEVTESRFKDKKVKIVTCGDCQDDEYIDPKEMLKASVTHKMDVHLYIGHPITKVDSKLVSDALTSVSKFTISGHCFDISSEKNMILSIRQLEDLLEGLEKREEVLEEIELLDLDLNYLNQERLASCLVNKVKKLTIDDGGFSEMLDSRTFINKLQGSSGGNLSHLTLGSLDQESYTKDSCFDLADALCNVEIVRLTREFYDLELFEFAILKRLAMNVVTSTRPIAMKTLMVDLHIYFEDLISPEDMRTVFKAMENDQFGAVSLQISWRP